MASMEVEERESLMEKHDLLSDDIYSVRYKRSTNRWRSIFSVLFAISITLNIIQSLHIARPKSSLSCRGSHSGLDFDTVVPFEPRSKYLDKNETYAEELWDAIDIGSMALALPQSRVEEYNLPPTQKFPWDPDKSVYFLRSLHQLHCLKSLRHTVVNLFNGKPTTMPRGHVLHCIDSLRQDIMCYADDGLLPAPLDGVVGQDFKPVCRSWDKLMEWSRQREFDSCWRVGDDYRPVLHSLERFRYCDKDSEYRPVMEKYFEIHGHKPMYAEDL